MDGVTFDSISPVFRTPFSDIGTGAINHQLMGECAGFELRMMECMEAYGMDRGNIKCKDLIADLRECAFKDKQLARTEFMAREMAKKEKAGLLDPASKKANDPPINSY